jgi:hypothetical protein
MADLPPDLTTAVGEQAQARIAMNIQEYSKYLTPEAVDTLRASFRGMPPRVNRYEISDVSEGGGDYAVEVRYFSRDESFVVRSRWHRENNAWMVVHAERLWAEGEKRPGRLSRLAASTLGFFGRRRR